MPVALVAPDAALLPGYLAALERHWTPDADDDPAGAARLIAQVRRDPAAFLASLSNPEGKGAPIMLDDATQVARLPWVRYWISDGEYAGDMNLRWQPGTAELPPYCLGHVGYAVMPWKRGGGYASQALLQLRPIAHRLGLPWLDISMDDSNAASRRTAERAGAVLIREFNAGPEYGGVEAVCYRMQVADERLR